MNIFVYADESGVFDPLHEENDVFVFGGLIFLGTQERATAHRRYISVERIHQANGAAQGHNELKAIYLSNKEKSSLFRAMNPYHRFGVVIEQKRVYKHILSHKKTKQRFLDYAFKRSVKAALQELLDRGLFSVDEVENLEVFMDEHNTATDGRYELCEALEQEFKIGTYNSDFSKFFPPLFPSMGRVSLKMHDSAQDPLIRAADITANRLYRDAITHGRNLVNTHISSIFLP